MAGEPVTKADAEVARSATGYAIGGVPPFGHATDVPVFMDRDLLAHETVWAAAGRPDSVFEIAPDRLRELSRRCRGPEGGRQLNEFRNLYVHLPFCRHKCGYCDFNAYAGMDRLMPDYVDALERELTRRPRGRARSGG